MMQVTACRMPSSAAVRAPAVAKLRSRAARALRSRPLQAAVPRLQVAGTWGVLGGARKNLPWLAAPRRSTVAASAGTADTASVLSGDDNGPSIWKLGSSDKEVVSPDEWKPPLPLPPTPKNASIVAVLPYVLRIASGDATLKLRIIASMIMLMVSKGAGLAAPVLLKNAIDSYSTAGPQMAARWVLLMGVAKVVNGVGNEIRNVIFAPIPQAAGRRVALHTLRHVLSMDVRFHLERRTGALSKIIDRGTRSVSMVFRAVLFTFLPTFVEMVLVCGVLWKSFEPRIAVMVVATFAAYAVFTASVTSAIAENRKEVNRLDQVANGKAVDALLNFETVVLFNNENLEASLYDQMLEDYQKSHLKMERIGCLLNGGQNVLLSTGVTAVLMLVVLSGATGGAAGAGISVGDIVMVNGLMLQLAAPLQFLGFFYRELRKSLVDMESMFKILQTDTVLKDGAVDLATVRAGGAAGPGPGSAGGNNGIEIRVRDVEFGYLEDRQILRGVSMDVHRGQSVALVGASGSGKSTLLRLMLRMYDANEGGSIEVDGVGIRDLTLDSLRRAIAVVPQDTVLFNDSILANIAYGCPSASRDQCIEAAKAARLHAAIELMPAGYDTVVGERGLKLSGGEKQRVAIARAFLKAPRLLVCDEATSALDSSTEAGILTSLQELAEGRTCVFVAHRLSTVRHCDNIIVMERGEIVEQGNHNDLLAMRGVGPKVGTYAQMWDLQQSEGPEAGAGEEEIEEDDDKPLRVEEVMGEAISQHLTENGV